jgi:hypothetical protein
MEIRRAVQSGDVEQATELVNDLDPEVSFFWSCVYFAEGHSTTTGDDYTVLCTTLRDNSRL